MLSADPILPAPPVKAAADGWATEGAVASDIGELPVPVTAVTVKAGGEELSTVAAMEDVPLYVAAIENVTGVSAVDPGITVSPEDVLARSSVAGMSIVPVLMIKVLV